MVFVSAVILAAGESKRMGQPKLLMPWGSQTILESTISNFFHSNVSEIIVILGHKARELTKAIGNYGVKIVVNRSYRDGMGTSLVCGVKAISPRSKGILLALADQPAIDLFTINKLIEVFAQNQRGIIIPVNQGKRGHPVIFDVKYREELLKVNGDVGAREIIKCHADDTLEVNVSCKGILIDIDTPADFHNHYLKNNF